MRARYIVCGRDVTCSGENILWTRKECRRAGGRGRAVLDCIGSGRGGSRAGEGGSGNRRIFKAAKL